MKNDPNFKSINQPSTFMDVLRRPGAIGAAGIAITALAAFGVVRGYEEASSDKVPIKPDEAFIVCYGSQLIDITGNGASVEGLIESHVSSNPKDRLKSDANLKRIARAIPQDGVDGSPLAVFEDEDGLVPELTPGSSFSIPKKCKLK